ncbi:hypothetical protein FACS189490_10860 [Clostridia bacterium]|nr:hypothetical protein FACS189490_10860 [Clostridia bacterium]
METNDIIMADDEVINTAAKIVKAGYGKGFEVIAIVGLAVIVGVVTYKYAVKPALAKIKYKKDLHTAVAAAVDEFYDPNDIEVDFTETE